MSEFIQLHLLTAYPPSNLNRDDLGRPKSAIFGGKERLRISSQSLKRAWRQSSVFEEAMGDFKGTRTKRLGVEVADYFKSKGVKDKDAEEWAKKIMAEFGKLESDKSRALLLSQLVHIAPEEQQAIYALADLLINEKREPNEAELKKLLAKPKAVDIAMFGRMLADSPTHNVEAAVQVAHAISVNQSKIEDDFFTAVDDLNNNAVDAGAGHMGEAAFGAGVFYLYLCINKSLLHETLQDDALVKRSIQALVRSAATVSPTGKQNSFASRAYTSYLLAEKGSQQPRSLSVAFLKAITGEDIMSSAIQALENQRINFETTYGACADAYLSMNAYTGEGSLQRLVDFVAD